MPSWTLAISCACRSARVRSRAAMRGERRRRRACPARRAAEGGASRSTSLPGGDSGGAASPGERTASMALHVAARSNASGAEPWARKKNDGPPSFSMRHQGHEPRTGAYACRGSSPQMASCASRASSSRTQSAADGRGPPAAAPRENARSKRSATGRVTSPSRSEKGGGSQPCPRASWPNAKSPSRIAASTGTTRARCRPAKGCRPTKSRWKTRTARPKRSWSCVLWTLSSLWPWSSGGVKRGTPTRHG